MALVGLDWASLLFGHIFFQSIAPLLKPKGLSVISYLGQTFPHNFPPELFIIWRKAAWATHLPDPFSSEPEWCLSYHLAISPNRPLFLFGNNGNCLFLAEEQMQFGPLLTPLEASWMYARPLMGSDPITLFLSSIEEIRDYYASQNKALPTIIFGGMWPHQPLSNELLLNAGHIFQFYLHSSGRQCAASLEGGVDGFLSRRSSNFRLKLKKSRRLAKEAGVTFERISPRPKQVSAVYERMLKVEAKSWKGAEDSGLLHQESQAFYLHLLTELSYNKVARVIFAKHEDQDIGFIFGGISNSIYRGQQFSYDLDWKKYSIGNIMQYETIVWLTEDQVGRYDMGPISGPRMEYKAHWTELVFPIQSWLLEPIKK